MENFTDHLELIKKVPELIKERAEVSANNSTLLERQKALHNDLKFTESQAFMDLDFEGKTQIAVVNDKAIALTNDRMRDAYKRISSSVIREELAKVEGAIAANNEIIAYIKDCLSAASIAMEYVKLIRSDQHNSKKSAELVKLAKKVIEEA